MSFHSSLITHHSSLYDVIVIGAGAAGLSAGLWCDELGLRTLVLEGEREIGGQLLRVYNSIENHLGVESGNGRELRDQFAAQIKKCNFELRTNSKVTAVDLKSKQVFLKNGEQISARALILATGVRRRKLNVAGEDEFVGRGILESGKRDYQSVAGKTVCIVGGGDAACENALILAETAKKVFLIHRRNDFRARKEFLENIRQNSRIEILRETRVLQIIGTEKVETVELQKNDSSTPFQIAVDAILIRIGVEPNSDLFREQLKTNDSGYTEINSMCETSVEKVFAIGDVANPLAPTVSAAVGMGATAAKVLNAKLAS